MTTTSTAPNMFVVDPPTRPADRTIGDAGDSAQADGKELTRTRLLRFGAIIGATILATMAIGIWSLRSSANDVKATRDVGDAVSAFDTTIENSLQTNRIRLIRAIAMFSGSDDLAAQMSAEGLAATKLFETNMATAVQMATDAGVDPDAIAALKEKTDAYIELALSIWDESQLTLTAESYDAYLARFLSLRGAQGELQTALDERRDAVVSTSDSNGTRGEVLVTLGSLGALAGLVVIGRRVIKSVGEARELKIEAAGAQGRERQQAEESQTAADELRHKVDSLLATLSAAAAGDLTARVEVSGTDAVGRVGEALSKLLTDLRVSISSIASNSQTLAAASEELQSVASQMGANSAETSNQVNLVSGASNEVTINIETVSAATVEMSASIKDIAQNAADAAKVATQAVEAARVTNATVAQLGESSAEIGEIVKVITGIAQQTNLLALNATIEAARAGEAGKGFAVVANEVKELAKETAKATEDISEKIGAIQTDTQRSVESIAGILEIIGQIAEFQDTIASAVEEQAATTSEIARSVNDASRGSSEITANIQGVASAADSTAAGASDSQRAASELARMAADLQTLVGKFTY